MTPVAFSWIDEGKRINAQGDAAAIAAAMNRFFRDTTRWPGQAEILKQESAVRFLVAGKATLPIGAEAIAIGPGTCTSGLRGVTPNVTSFSTTAPSTANSVNVMDFLLRRPSPADYPNWQGPYLTAEINGDPWGRAWVINVIPLFCGEAADSAAPGGALGYAWIFSGGPNRTLQTRFSDARLNPDADDVGVNLSKRVTQGPNG